MGKRKLPIGTLLVLGGVILGFILGYTLKVDSQVDREVNFRLERILDGETHEQP